jgi:nucleotide-binding universal stress UspA family protein
MKILLATDGSDTARAAVDYLLAFPLPTEASFMVATVIREVLAADVIDELDDAQRETYDSARSDAERSARALLDGEMQRIRAAGFDADSRILTGHPAEEIVDLATELACDIVVVGSHGYGGGKRFLLGSTSDRVFEYAPCSVLIVKHPAATAGVDERALPEAGGKWRLLLAFDDSAPARSAVELCAGLPLAGRAVVRILTIMPMIHMFRQDIRQQCDWIWQRKMQALRLALDWAAAQFDNETVEVATELVEGDKASQEIIDRATAGGDDLVVVGHKGRKALERFFLGSVTARIAHHAPCSVLSVRTRD